MTTHTQKNIADHLRWRYATKRFDPSKKIEPATWQKLEEALILTPSSYGLQPWKFVVVTDQSAKEALVPASMGQSQPADCSHLVVFARQLELTEQYIERYLDHIAAVRQLPKEKLAPMQEMMLGFKKRMSPEQIQNWMAKQCYIALGNLMTVASIYEVDNCPMEGFAPAEVDRILKLHDKGCTSVVMCALGYRAADDKYAQLTKVRFAASDLVIHI